jgi:hypothetical protein
MTIPYAQSLRSVYNRNHWPSLIALAIALALLVAWLVWFVMARVPLYVTSQAISVSSQGYLLVTFPPEELIRVQPGQPATLTLNSEAQDQPSVQVPAYVRSVRTAASDQAGTVELELFPNENTLAPGVEFQIDQVTSAVSRQMAIEVERVSPAVLVLRAAGKYVNAP